MKDPTCVEAARHLAARMIRSSPRVADQIQFGYRILLARDAKPAEVAVLTRAFDRALTQFAANANAATGLLKTGEPVPAQQTLAPAALATLLNPRAVAGAAGLSGLPHFAPKAKRIIWLTQSGAPSQLDLFDPKPGLKARFNTELPDSVRGTQRLTGMTAKQARFPVAPSIFNFARQGKCGMELSELLPFTSQHADDICLIRSMHTEAINHDPAMTLLQTGHQIAGRPSFGSWIAYGLGNANENLPAFIVLVSRPSGGTNAQPLAERMWGSGFLPAKYQGVRFNSGKDPVLYLSNPEGLTSDQRRAMLDDLGALNRMKLADYRDPEIQARIDQFEMAFLMQSSVPDLADLSKETPKTFENYGPESRKPGTYAANCLLARRLAERGVRFIQVYHRGLDQACAAAARHQEPVLRHRSADRRADQRFERARTFRRHAHRLGRRVRAHRVFAGRAHAGQLRSRPPSTLLQPVGRRRGHQARPRHRRDRRLQL